MNENIEMFLKLNDEFQKHEETYTQKNGPFISNYDLERHEESVSTQENTHNDEKDYNTKVMMKYLFLYKKSLTIDSDFSRKLRKITNEYIDSMNNLMEQYYDSNGSQLSECVRKSADENLLGKRNINHNSIMENELEDFNFEYAIPGTLSEDEGCLKKLKIEKQTPKLDLEVTEFHPRLARSFDPHAIIDISSLSGGHSSDMYVDENLLTLNGAQDFTNFYSRM